MVEDDFLDRANVDVI
jgi:thioredoxin reductase